MPSLDRWTGCLLGLAVGDALGMVVEAASPADAAAYAAALPWSDHRALPARAPYARGQYTDDTQSARELIASLAARGRWVPQDFARRLVALVRSGRGVGFGRGSRAAVDRLASGTPWSAAGEPAPYAGNGAAMRVAPIGLAYATDENTLVRIAVEQGRVTHQDPRALGMAVAVALAVGRVSLGRWRSPEALMREIEPRIRAIDPAAADAIARVPVWAALGFEEARADLDACCFDPAGPAALRGISVHAVPSVAWGIAAFLRYPESPKRALRDAIGIGGDTDTMAAIAGALIGAHLGERALPSAIVDALHDAHEWDAAGLRELVERARDALAPG